MIKARESNFELMRIISMFFIIMWHIIIHGHVIENCANEALGEYLKILKYIIVVHVNSFALLTGYFQSKSNFKLSKLFSLFLQIIFISSLTYIVALRIGWIDDYNLVSILKNLLPSSMGGYWFMSCYVILYIISDFLNKFIDDLRKDEYEKVLLVLFIAFSIIPFTTGNYAFNNSGYTLYNFIFFYLLGGYLRRYSLKNNYYFKKFSINGYKTFLIFLFLMIAFSNCFLDHYFESVSSYSNLFGELSNRVLANKLSYSSPFIIIQTVCYFEFFKYLTIKSKFINYIASCVFSIYMLHDNAIIRKHLYYFLKIDDRIIYSYKFLFYMILVALIIFIFGFIIESLRKIIFYLLSKTRIVKKTYNKIKRYFQSLNISINW